MWIIFDIDGYFFFLSVNELLDIKVNSQNVAELFIFNENPEETLILSIRYGIGNQSTQVVAFNFNQESNRWLKLQKMRFKKDYIEPYSILDVPQTVSVY